MGYQGLIQDAHEEGIENIIIKALVHKEDGKVLLIEDLQGNDSFYHFPYAALKKEETISQAIQRAVTENTRMEIQEVLRYLGHYDKEGIRHFNFVVKVRDPYKIEENKSIAFAWLEVQEAVGYPIQDEEREMLDLYMRS